MALAAGLGIGLFTYVWRDWASRYCVFDCSSAARLDSLENLVIGLLLGCAVLFVAAGGLLLAGMDIGRWPLVAAGPLMLVPTGIYLVLRVRSTVQQPAMAMVLVDAVLAALSVAGFASTRTGAREPNEAASPNPSSTQVMGR